MPPKPLEALPSGSHVRPLDLSSEVQIDGQLWLVLRYLSPVVSATDEPLSYEAVAPDLDALCDGPGRQAVAAAAAQGARPDQVVIVLTDRPSERGIPDPDVTSFLAAYRVGPEGCVWQ